jgi:2'-5' RNA ligase superfamily
MSDAETGGRVRGVQGAERGPTAERGRGAEPGLSAEPGPGAESAVIVAVPEAEPVVGAYRAQMDSSATLGVPAHVTVIYPFLPPDQIDGEALARLREAVATVSCFDATFRRTAWFDQDVLWLQPDPDEHFRALTRAVWDRFPQCPPYGGEHADPIPHLTVADQAPPARMREVERLVAPHLPVTTRVTHARLIVGTGEPPSFVTGHELPLSPPAQDK